MADGWDGEGDHRAAQPADERNEKAEMGNGDGDRARKQNDRNTNRISFEVSPSNGL